MPLYDSLPRRAGPGQHRLAAAAARHLVLSPSTAPAFAGPILRPSALAKGASHAVVDDEQLAARDPARYTYAPDPLAALQALARGAPPPFPRPRAGHYRLRTARRPPRSCWPPCSAKSITCWPPAVTSTTTSACR
ncbi:MAG: hypothetical protein WKG07_25375 [Hymenobacter sp.]